MQANRRRVVTVALVVIVVAVCSVVSASAKLTPPRAAAILKAVNRTDSALDTSSAALGNCDGTLQCMYEAFAPWRSAMKAAENTLFSGALSQKSGACRSALFKQSREGGKVRSGLDRALIDFTSPNPVTSDRGKQEFSAALTGRLKWIRAARAAVNLCRRV
jgi:hypothetical protein